MKYFITSLVVIVIFAAALGSYFVFKPGMAGNKKAASATAAPTISDAASPEVSVTVTPGNAKTVEAGGILTFPKFKISLPEGWESKKESENKDLERVILTKAGYSITITQGGFGGSPCNFPGDPVNDEAMGAKYDGFKDLETKSGDNFRRAWTGEESKTKGYAICQNTQYGWQAPTLYGHISLAVPLNADKNTVAEMDSILTSLEKIK